MFMTNRRGIRSWTTCEFYWEISLMRNVQGISKKNGTQMQFYRHSLRSILRSREGQSYTWINGRRITWKHYRASSHCPYWAYHRWSNFGKDSITNVMRTYLSPFKKSSTQRYKTCECFTELERLSQAVRFWNLSRITIGSWFFKNCGGNAELHESLTNLRWKV